MDEPPVELGSTVLEILIAELNRQGILDGQAISNMSRRLDEAGLPDQAEAISFLVIANALDTPQARRAGIHSIDGGNGEN